MNRLPLRLDVIQARAAELSETLPPPTVEEIRFLRSTFGTLN